MSDDPSHLDRRQFLIGAGMASLATIMSRTFGRFSARPDSGFVISLWSGAITPTSVRINSRIDHDSATVRALASTSPGLSNPIYSPFATASVATNNRMVPLRIQGLAPNTHYYYAIESQGMVDGTQIGQFRTPASGAFSFSVAFASCAETSSNHPIFNTIRQHNPLFFIHMGDMHYRDIGINDRDLFRQAYDDVLGQPNQAALYRNVPIAYMWDDHDYGPNDSDATSPSRLASRLTYQEYVPHYPLVAGSGDVPIYQAFTIGRVRFILTDTRSERTPKTAPDDASKSMMGPVQKAWFKQQLLSANGVYPVIVWVCTSPWIADPPGSGDDNWAGYTTERRELANFIQDNNIEGLFMLSGDVHMVAIDDGRNNTYSSGGGRSFPIMQAAPIDRGNGTWLPGNTYSEGQYPGQNQFGLMTVADDGGPEIRIVWSGRNKDDEQFVWLEMTVPPSPRLSVSPKILSFVKAVNGSEVLRHNLGVTNLNVGTIDWTATVVPPTTWLTMSPTSGSVVFGETDDVVVDVDASGLAYGFYETELHFSASGATHSPQIIRVTFLYTDEPPVFLPVLAKS
jgi:phosphodiesterase/alkaline phosphatase D-like protein